MKGSQNLLFWGKKIKKSLKSVVWFGSVQFLTQKMNAGIMHLFIAF